MAGIIIGVIVLIVIIVIVAMVIGTYNGLIKLKNSVEEAFSTMDVYLKKRHDLIPNLVETVKGYATHEKETLEKVIQARNMATQSKSPEESIQNENMLTGTLRSLFAISENYPDLKANANFLDLQNQLKVVENDIASSRKYYNGVVKAFNIKIESFPSNIIAGMFHFTKRPMFEIEEGDRENVQVQF